MKLRITRNGAAALMAGALFSVVAGCSQKVMDRDLKADITIKAKSEIDFAGVVFTVSEGVVALSGNCPTEKARASVEEKVKGIAGVKEVENRIAVAPLALTADFPLKQSVDSVLKKEPKAFALVADSTVTLKGQVEKDKVGDILKGLQSLRPKRLENQLVLE
jgi:hypothetical protein